MNHDYTHCFDVDDSCPKKCFRKQLVDDLNKTGSMIPVAWSHMRGTKDCPKYKGRKE